MDATPFIGKHFEKVKEECGCHVCVIEKDSERYFYDIIPGRLYVCLTENIVTEAWFA